MDRESLAALLAQPDPPELIGLRRHVWTQPRDPRRDPEVLKRDLATAYVQHRRQERQWQGDISAVVSVRRQRRLSLVGLQQETA
jgi:hypothetical protein